MNAVLAEVAAAEVWTGPLIGRVMAEVERLDADLTRVTAERDAARAALQNIVGFLQGEYQSGYVSDYVLRHVRVMADVAHAPPAAEPTGYRPETTT